MGAVIQIAGHEESHPPKFECWMASTTAGLSSRTAMPALEEEKSPSNPYCKRWSNAKVSSRDSDPHPCCGNISPDSWEPRASPTSAPSGTRNLWTVLARRAAPEVPGYEVVGNPAAR